MLSLTRCSLLLAVCAPVFAQNVLFPTLSTIPTKEWGHATLPLPGTPLGTSPNLLEGRELYNPSGIAIDTTSSPPILYVADANNHRVLAWQNPAGISAGDVATRVIGQKDLFSGFAGGPGAPATILTAAGLTLPSAVAVDSSGNLYVMDSGNNRILRFPKPLLQSTDSFVQPDLVIGQKTATSGKDNNQGQPKPSEKTLSLRSSGAAGGGMEFDGQGNLWVADTYNHRVLRFPQGRLSGSEPAADIVLGQSLFTTNNHIVEDYSLRANLDAMVEPIAVAVDARGGVYVSDKLLRVLYYPAPATGVLASRVLGVQPAPPSGQQPPPYPTDYSIGLVSTPQGTVSTLAAQCLFTSGNVLFVCDTIAHRILRYNPSDQWAAATPSAPSPAAVAVIGQDSMTASTANRGQGQYLPNGNSLNFPLGGAFLNNELWVVDNGNNRVLSLPMAAGFTFGNASRVVGQKRFDTYAPNLVEGRELFVYAASGAHGSSVIVDKSSTPNHLYIADSQNNRVLAFNDIRKVGTDRWGTPNVEPDLIIGQPDKVKTGPNYPTYDASVPSDQGLFAPTGVAVDAQGNLWVADSGNGRVLRFPAPFSQTGGGAPRANLVLGQANFTFTVPDPSSSTMAAPVSVVVFNNGDVAAADIRHNRVLLWKRPAGGDFSNGQSARAVLGQQNFFSTTASSVSAGLNAPRGMTMDTGDRLYVADSGNNRVVVYNSTGNIANGASGIIIQAGLNSPESVAVSPANGAIWVASFANQQIYRYAEYSQLGTGPQPQEQFGSNAPMAIALDSKDNLIVVEATNRMSFFYGYVLYRNAANYTLSQNVRNNTGLDSNSNSLTPGMYTVIAKSPNTTPFTFTPGAATLPFPKQFGGVEVLVQGVPAPIWRLDNAYVVFLMPNNVPTGGIVEIMVRDTTTGEVLGAGTHPIGDAAPAFFTASQDGKGQISATNTLEGTPNSAQNKIATDGILTIWMNGYGHLDNAPDDGVPAGRVFDTDVKPVIYVGAYQVPPEKILYSGLSPEFPGLWQINFKVPKVGDPGFTGPSDKAPIIVRMRDRPSNVLGNDGGLYRVEDTWIPVNDIRITTFAIK